MLMFDGTLYIIYPYPEGLNADLYDIEEARTIESQCFGGVCKSKTKAVDTKRRCNVNQGIEEGMRGNCL